MTCHLSRYRRLLILAALGSFLAKLVVAVSPLRAADPPSGPLPVGNPTAAEFAGLQNVFRLSEKLYTGSAPEGEAGFQSLQHLGIKTILTVDGAAPDVERATSHGMRYVHLPFGYDGCPAPTANRIVRAVRDLPGPIYLHCHHGKHRAPTAAAFARIALDGVANEQAVREMERAGTGKEYVGLYRDVRAYHAPTSAEMDRVTADFPALSPTPPLTEAMVQIDNRLTDLLLCQKEDWKTPRRHSDLLPAHEALQLRELFTELVRTPEVAQRPIEFRRRMGEEERRAAALETALRAGDTARAGRLLGHVTAGCAGCHARYRDVPGG